MTWNSSSSYSDDDVMRMQQDAVRRVKEMQAKAQATLETVNREHPDPPPPPRKPGSPQRRQPPPPVPSPVEQLKDLGQQVLPAVEDVLEGGSIADLINAFLPQDDDSAVGGVLKALKLDGEKILILGLLLFLMNAKADKTILLALFYLLF